MHAEEDEMGREQRQQRRQNQPLNSRQDESQVHDYQDEVISLVVHHEAGTNSSAREARRRQYQRRMTLDPLAQLLGNENVSHEAEETIDEHHIEEERGDDDVFFDDVNIDAAHAAVANNNGNGNEATAASGSFNENYSELQLPGELLGIYDRNGSADDSEISGEEDGNENENGDPGNSYREPPQPARNHSYLPTAQPLYPEEWIPAGKHRRRSTGSNRDLFDADGNVDTEAKYDDYNEGSEISSNNKSNNKLQGMPLTLPHTYDDEMKRESDDELGITPPHSGSITDLTTLAVMEIEDVVLFPGSVVPLRLRNRDWVYFLGRLIDDARGLYGSHKGTAEGKGEVRIAILPRIREGDHQIQRPPREGVGQNGRGRGGLIRRGLAGARRLTRRRRRSESVETDMAGYSGRVRREDRRTIQDDAESPRIHSSERLNSDNEDGNLFSPAAAPLTPADPLVGRIATVATITFTHEETDSSAIGDESLAAGGTDAGSRGFPSPRHSRRSSSIVWQDRQNELVVTVLGTSRVRLIRSVGGDKSNQDRNTRIPLYAVEEVYDGGSASLPPSWMMRLSAYARYSISTPSVMVSIENGPGENDMESGTSGVDESRARCEVCGDSYSSAIRNLSLRSSTPATAYQALWPWSLVQRICNVVSKSDEFQGLKKILPSAAGLHFDTSASDTVEAAAPIQFQVVDPPSFANWIASNMPLSQNNRLDLLEMCGTVEQLRYILQKLEEKKQETVLRCKYCGAVISQMRHVFSVGGSEGTTGAYVNEHGIVHQTVTLKEVDGHSITCIGGPQTRDSWFPGYSWTIAYCSICSNHLGWKFRKVSGGDGNNPDRPRSFWGFSNITTDNHVTPTRVSFHTQQVLAE